MILRARWLGALAMAARQQAETREEQGALQTPEQIAKRVNWVHDWKITLDYLAFAQRREAGGAAATGPPTPDPTDRTVSRRQWNKSTAEWRQGIRSFNRRAAGQGAAAPCVTQQPQPAAQPTSTHAPDIQAACHYATPRDDVTPEGQEGVFID